MKKSKLIAGAALMVGLTVGGTVAIVSQQKVEAARTDMVDLSNHNGSFSLGEFLSMRNDYGVKAITTKIKIGRAHV